MRARGDMASGIFGEMMLTYFAGKGGIGLVIDGCIRDSEKAEALNLGYWMRGVTPNFHTQTHLMPYAVNTPIACGNVLVMPGDIIIANNDGAVAVPAAMAEALLERASHHVEWEEFSRVRLAAGEISAAITPSHLTPRWNTGNGRRSKGNRSRARL